MILIKKQGRIAEENTKETKPQKNAAWNNKNNLKPTHSTWNLNEPESNFWTRPKIWKILTRKWFIKKSQPNSKHLTSEKTNKIFFRNSPTMKLFTKLPWWKKRPNLKNFPNFKLRILLRWLNGMSCKWIQCFYREKVLIISWEMMKSYDYRNKKKKVRCILNRNT